jgi:DUF438 domain-containing protein
MKGFLMEKDLNYYSIIPGKVMSSEKLTDKAKLVFGVITALSNKYGYCNAKNQYLADVFKITPTWISKILAQLKKEKCVKITYVAKERRIYPIMDAFGGVMSTEKREGKPATPAKSYKPVKNPNVPIDAGAARLVKQMEEKMRQSMSMPVTPITTEIN